MKDAMPVAEFSVCKARISNSVPGGRVWQLNLNYNFLLAISLAHVNCSIATWSNSNCSDQHALSMSGISKLVGHIAVW